MLPSNKFLLSINFPISNKPCVDRGGDGGGGAMHKIILKFNSLQNCLRLRVFTYTPQRAAICKYFFYHSIKGNG